MTKSQPPTQPTSRRERRAMERAERSERPRQRSASPGKATQPAWRSPMVLITGGALVLGLAIIGYSIFQRPAATPPPSDDIIRPASVVPAGLSNGRTLGIADAPVTVEIWSDFQCPACRTLATDVEPDIIDEYVVPGTAKLVYRDAAFQGQKGTDPNYDESVESAAAARCGGEQGKFWEMHDWIFANWNGENEGAFNKDRLRAIAGAAGLDLAVYDACMATGDQQAAVRAETTTAVGAGINSTPTLIVNGVTIPGLPSFEQLAAVIEQAAN